MNPHVRKVSERAGFSLVEVLLASAIVVVGILPMLTVLISTGDSIRQTRSYYQAVFLGNHAIEESRLAAEEDVHFLDRVLTENYGEARGAVVQGNHPFFAVLEDSASPDGRLVERVDWSIQPEAGPLFELVEPLAMRLESVDQGGRVDCNFHFDWLDTDGRPRTFSMGTPATRWLQRDRIGGLEELDRPAPATPAGSMAEVLALGEMAEAVQRDAQTVLDRFPTTGSTSGSAADRGPWKRAVIHEATAARMLQIAQWMGPHILKLAEPIPDGALGTQAADILLAKERMGQILQGLWTHLALAITEGDRAAMAAGMSMGERYTAHRLVLRAMKMDIVLRSAPTAPLEAWCRSLVTFYEGRMAHAAHFLGVEATNATRLDQTYSLRPALLEIVTAQQSLVRAATNLVRYARALPTP
jgi:hypothetical protein